MMNGIRERLLSILTSRLFKLATGLVVLVWLSTKTQFLARLHEGHVSVRAPYAFLGIFLGIFVMAVRAWRWNVILSDLGKPLPIWHLMRVYGAAFFLGLISPGRIGEVVRIWLAKDAVPTLSAAAVSVVFDRVFDVLPSLIVTAAFSASVAFGESAHSVLWIRAGIAILALIALGLLFYPQKMQNYIERIVQRSLRRLGVSEETAESKCQTLSRRALAYAFAISVFSQLIVLVQAWLFCEAVSASGVNPLVVFSVVTMATVVAALPLSVGGIGTREAAVASALAALGLNATKAMSFSMLTLANFMIVASVTMIAFVCRPEGMPTFGKSKSVSGRRGEFSFGSQKMDFPDEGAAG